MSVPAALKQHIHVTERDGTTPWNDCTWAAGLEWHRLFRNPATPATIFEMHQLRAASGEPTTGGSNIPNLREGIRVRYKYTAPAPISGFSVLWNSMNGRVAVAQGSMKAFGAASRYSRWDMDFDGAHAVLAYRPKDEDRVWWCDPLAPSWYQGEWMSKADFQRYVNAFGGQHLVGAIREEAITMAQAVHTDETPKIIDVPAGTMLYELDGKTPYKTVSTAVNDRFSPFGAAGGRAIYSGTFGKDRRVSIVKNYSNERPVVDRTPYSAEDVNSAKASGVAQERGRLRTLLGL